MKQLALGLIWLYQLLSPFPGVCRYQVSCSEYMKRSIIQYGTVRGILRGLRRILSCRP